jgi:hypothetical protein
MKQIILFIGLISFSNIQYGQILNGEFDDWVLIEGNGQPYQDLVSWQTNNENDGGLATTPNVEIIVNNDTGVAITTNYHGMDGKYSGKIKQTINTEKVKSISYLSKCDSIFDYGACVVNIYDAANNLTYTDSIKQKETSYSIKVIEMDSLSLDDSDMMTIEFVAYGQIGFFEEFQAYSEFNVLRVEAELVLNISETKKVSTLNVYPNPALDILNIDLEVGFKGNIIITNTSGEDIYNHQVSDASLLLDVSEWISGIYYLVVNSESNSSVARKIIITK